MLRLPELYARHTQQLDSQLTAHSASEGEAFRWPEVNQEVVLPEGEDVLAQLVLLVTAFGLCLLYTSPSPRDVEESRMPSSA